MSDVKFVGVVGYGNIGQFLVKEILRRDDMRLAFVWNRTPSAMDGEVPAEYILTDLIQFTSRKVDLIVEVAHPDITSAYGEKFLNCADFMVGSPTALADKNLEQRLRAAARLHGLYVPVGALWGASDIKRMADRKSLAGLKITMTKNPHSFKLRDEIAEKCDSVTTERTVLYDGTVRDLCSLAPHNVNTMAAACVAAHNLGFDGVQGSIVADPTLDGKHIIEIEVRGIRNEIGEEFNCKTTRLNPAKEGQVTGSATFHSFLSSLLAAGGKGPGLHIC